MSATTPPVGAPPVIPELDKPLPKVSEPTGLLKWIGSVDHKQIGIMYICRRLVKENQELGHVLLPGSLYRLQPVAVAVTARPDPSLSFRQAW